MHPAGIPTIAHKSKKIEAVFLLELESRHFHQSNGMGLDFAIVFTGWDWDE